MTPAEINAQTIAAAEMWRLNDVRNKAMAATMKAWQIKQAIVSAILGIVLTALSYAVAHLAGWDVAFNWLEVLALTTSYSCTWLCVVQSRLNYLIGAVSVALYSMLFFNAGYNALACFNLYLIISLLYGWFRWGNDSKPKLVTSLQLDRWAFGYIVIGISIASLCILVNQYFPGTFGPMDIWITALSGVAQALLDNKRLQTWHVWLAVNILSMWAFYNSSMYLILLQYVFFTINTFLGYTSWKRAT